MNAITALLPLVLQFGLPAVQQLISMFTKSTPPTDSDWAVLLSLTQKTAKQQMLETLSAHGIDPNSPQGVSLLNLVSF